MAVSQFNDVRFYFCWESSGIFSRLDDSVGSH